MSGDALEETNPLSRYATDQPLGWSLISGGVIGVLGQVRFGVLWFSVASFAILALFTWLLWRDGGWAREVRQSQLRAQRSNPPTEQG
jgi:membrane protein implicated in regulation of membrane protease activity